MQKLVIWAPEEHDKIVIMKDSANDSYKFGEIYTVNRSMLDSMTVTVKEKLGVVIPYEDYQLIPPTKERIELDVSSLKVTYFDAKIGHAAAFDGQYRMYYSRDNLKTWQEVELQQNDERRRLNDFQVTLNVRAKFSETESTIAKKIDQLLADHEVFRSWGTTVKGVNWQGEAMDRPNHIQAHIEEKVATRILCAVEELSKSPAINNVVQFVAYKDGQPHHIPAERITGVFEALHAKYVELKNWCWLQEAEKELIRSRTVQSDVALSLGLVEVATLDEIAAQAKRLKEMGDQMDRLKSEYAKFRDQKGELEKVEKPDHSLVQSPFKPELRRPKKLGSMSENLPLQQALEIVTEMIPVKAEQFTPDPAFTEEFLSKENTEQETEKEVVEKEQVSVMQEVASVSVITNKSKAKPRAKKSGKKS